MKQKLTRNIGLKILSIILAALLWVVITNMEDPITTESYYNVEVDVLNEDDIDSLNQVYEIVEGKTIDFTVAARRSITDKLTVSDFRVTADLAKLSDLNTVTINITCPRYGDEVTIKDGLNQVMKVEREELEERALKVNVVQKGEPAEGYYVAKKTSNTILTVSGPKTKIESIAQIVVEVDVSRVEGSFQTSEEPKALDEEGNEIDSSNLEFSINAVTIDVEMYRTKTIDLMITTSGVPLNGYVKTNIEYEPKTIEIAGEDSALENMTSLTIEENIDDAFQNIEKEVNIQDSLDDYGLTLVDDNKTAVVNITIEEAQTKEISVLPEEIEIRNKPASVEVHYLSTGTITLMVTGPAEEIEDISLKKLKPYIDLSDYPGGTYIIEVEIDEVGLVTLKNNPVLSVYLN